MNRRCGLLAVLVALVLGAVACGIPSDDQPRAIPEAAVPEQALEPRGTGDTSSTASANAPTQEQTIYLVGGSAEQPRLLQVPVQVASSTDSSALAKATIEQLIDTRPEDVGQTGMATNQIPSSVEVRSATIGGDGVLDLDLTLELSQIESARLRLAVAQIVFTATDLKAQGVNGVRFFINGQPATGVPTQAGSSVANQVVTRADYPDLDPQLQQPAE